MILVTGATGNLGKSVIRFLLQKGVTPVQIAALVRDPSKSQDLSAMGIETRTGDYRDYTSLLAAFAGIEKLLLISSSDMNDRSSQHINAVRAAKEAGVQHIIYTSFQRKNETNSPIQFISEAHLAAEREIIASGMTYTFLQNGLYADIIPWFLGEKVLENGISLPAADGRAAFTVREDIAEATANVLMGTGHENKIYQTATNETNSFEDVARIVSELSGVPVMYRPMPVTEFRDSMEKAAVPAGIIQMFSSFSQAIGAGEFDFSNNHLESLLFRKPTCLKEFLKPIYSRL